jgi:hypothetical protein
MSCSRFYCDYGCKTEKKNPRYFLSEANRIKHYSEHHPDEYSNEFPLSFLGRNL